MTETVFNQVNYDLHSLMDLIGRGEIGLPHIQRPFVWKNIKVRDLFDSIYRGYPVGYLLFWQNGLADDQRAIGTDAKQKATRLLIVDGQQRLTSLYAVIRNMPVVRENYATEHIKIAFKPLLGRFEVADAAVRRDPTYIPDISQVWSPDADLFEIVDDYLAKLRTGREVTPHEVQQIRQAMIRLQGLGHFGFIALELSAAVDEEQVAEVFVRVNSKGTPLNQADFILTLMSVFWDEGRSQLEAFCRHARKPPKEPSSFNHFIQPDPDQLLRVSVGLGFKRARLQHVYSILRGKDLETGEFSVERRDRQFEILKKAQSQILDLGHWHDFLKAIDQAGYRGMRMISSRNTVLYSYVLYLMGRTEYGVDEYTLRRAIACWFFMASITGRYTGSPESTMEFDLARFRDIHAGDEFVRTLEQVCDQTLTEDFWKITLPNALATSSSRSPSLFAYYAALVLLDARILFSHTRVADALDPSTGAPPWRHVRHHLFPRNHLKSLGIVEHREVNQIGNYAFVEWGDNAAISDQPPAEYLPTLAKRLSAEELFRAYRWHALPDGWENLEYSEFLIQRRERMAHVIADAYAQLRFDGWDKAQDVKPLPITDLVTAGETGQVEFKSTLRINLHTGKSDPRIELACLKTIAGFLNGTGGTLVIGVGDDGKPVGLEADAFPNEDRISLHLVNLIKGRIGPAFMMYIHLRFDDWDGKRVLVAQCSPSKSPVMVKDGAAERFYIRTGPATTELTASQILEYTKRRFS